MDHVINLNSSVNSRRLSAAGIKPPVVRKLEPDTPQKDHPRHQSAARIWSRRVAATLLVVFAISAGAALVLYGSEHSASETYRMLLQQAPAEVKRDTLVLYMFANTDSQYIKNLEYFIQEAMVHQAEHNRAQYVVIVQTADDIETAPLPDLPPNADYVYHKNQCYDWGTFGWILRSGAIDLGKYQYFLFINSSVRGPFMPSYLRGTMHWTTPFISQLSDDAKLVGPAIACEGSPYKGNANAAWRRNPHVQSYVMATDRDGLQVLLDDPHVFECHSDRWDAIWYSELGSSAAILKAGYNLASFMIRYQGVDWRDVRNWGCNGDMGPTGINHNDGHTLDPYEAMFVKFKGFMLEGDSNSISAGRPHPSAVQAAKYQLWQDQQLMEDDWDKNISGNDYPTVSASIRLPKVLVMLRRGSRCFDLGYYFQGSPDIKTKVRGNETAAWSHFVFHGQFQDRAFRFICDDLDYAAVAAPPA